MAKEEIQVENIKIVDSQEVVEVEIPLYLKAESKNGVDVNIMDLQLMDLIFEKMFLLFQRLQPAMKDLESAKIELQNNKDKLLLETDFKTELGESRPTVAMKEAYMKPLLATFEEEVDKYNDLVMFYKDKVNVLNDLIKAQRTLLAIEGALTN